VIAVGDCDSAEDVNSRPPGPETTEICQVVDCSIRVSGASTAQTHVILVHRSQSFSYALMGAPEWVPQTSTGGCRGETGLTNFVLPDQLGFPMERL
jgi:hypothetical protein